MILSKGKKTFWVVILTVTVLLFGSISIWAVDFAVDLIPGVIPEDLPGGMTGQLSPTSATDVYLEYSELKLNEGANYTMPIYNLPSGMTVTWISSNNNVASVNSSS